MIRILKNHTSAFLMVVLLGIVSSGFATPTQSGKTSVQGPVFTLTDVIALAIRNNPTLVTDELNRVTQKLALLSAEDYFEPQYSLISDYNFTSTKAGAPAVFKRTANVVPTVTLNGHYGTTYSLAANDNLTYLSPSSNNPFSKAAMEPQVTFSVTQQLLAGSSRAVVDAALNEAKDNETINKLTFQSDVSIALNTVINDYFTLIGAELSLSVDRNTEKSYEITAYNESILVKAGQQPQANLLDAQAQVANQKITIANDVNQVNTDRQTLLQDIGLKSDMHFILPANLIAELRHDEYILTGGKSIPSLAESQQAAVLQRPDYQTAILELHIASLGLLSAKDAARWQLALTASRQQGGEDPNNTNYGLNGMLNGHNAEDQIGLKLTVPIDNFTNESNIITQKIALQNAVIALDSSRRTVYSSVEQALNTLLSEKEQVTLSQQALDLQRKNVANSQALHKVGNISTFELVTKQQALATASTNFVQTKIAYLTDLATYDQNVNLLLDRFNIRVKY